MAKLKTHPITLADINEYVDAQSDFAFELKIHNQLLGHDFECEHGATYEDPITKKIRQFDVRAVWTKGPERLRLAVECKQPQPHFPLVVFRVPREFDESAHEVILSVNPDKVDLDEELAFAPAFRTQAMSLTIQGRSSIYNEREFVGKSCVQVGRELSGALCGTDSDAFSKWTQAISSAQELAQRAYFDGEDRSYGSHGQFPFVVTAVVPVLVVPDGRLWAIDFNRDGSRSGGPAEIKRCQYFINAACVCGDLNRIDYNLTHIEFVTASGLDDLVDDLTNELHGKSYFDRERVSDLVGWNDGQSRVYGW